MKNSNTKQNKTVADKVACGLVNRITGSLAVRDVESDVTSLPIGQCLLVYAMNYPWGYKTQEEWVRIGLYSLTPSGPRIMYAVKAPNRVPALRESVFSRSRGMAEVAAVNWAMGALFSGVPDGAYHMNPASGEMPRDKTRTFFGSMRTWESSVEMFNTCATGWAVPGMKLTAPLVFPVATLESALEAVDGQRDKLGKIGVEYSMSRSELAGHIRNEFNSVVNSLTTGVAPATGQQFNAAVAEFRTSAMGELNAQFYRMRNAGKDSLAYVKSQDLMASWVDNLAARIASKLKTAGVAIERQEVDNSLLGIQYSLRKWLALHDYETATMVIPSDTGVRRSPARHDVFANPLFHAVSLYPMQVVSDTVIPYGGELPSDGLELFTN